MASPVIYQTTGRAREYAALALNLYQGCTHGETPPAMCRLCPDIKHHSDIGKWLCARTGHALPIDEFNAGNPIPPECDSGWEGD